MKFWKWFRIIGVIGVIGVSVAIWYFTGSVSEQATDGSPSAAPAPAEQAPTQPSYYR